MERLPYVMVRGCRSDAFLLYTTKEQHLYVKKYERNNKTEYVCYQTILFKRTASVGKCTSGVQVKDGICTRKKNGHTSHESHKKIYDDLITRHKINDACISLKDMCEDLCITVPARNIFTREIAK